MKRIIAFHIAWILVGCIFAEAAFMAVQIGLTIVTSQQNISLHDMLSPNNPLYAIPPHFLIVSIVFIVAIIFAEARQLYNLTYYVAIGLVAAILYIGSLSLSGMPLSFQDTVINLVAAAVSGAVYWWITPRRFNRATLSEFGDL
ncbi:hypothetical protein [uncultured Bartonella sp.]|uniref:hypothetical protein n=1 Tax=uncultured Bartonella sp. TaxID=104108 RepID=UPI0026264A48|nr:hypothetical protein [uncultured Bartonella sp.]